MACYLFQYLVFKKFLLFPVKTKPQVFTDAALQTGIDFALQKDASRLVTFDADGQHSAEDIPAIIAPLLEGQADIYLLPVF